MTRISPAKTTPNDGYKIDQALKDLNPQIDQAKAELKDSGWAKFGNLSFIKKVQRSILNFCSVGGTCRKANKKQAECQAKIQALTDNAMKEFGAPRKPQVEFRVLANPFDTEGLIATENFDHENSSHIGTSTLGSANRAKVGGMISDDIKNKKGAFDVDIPRGSYQFGDTSFASTDGIKPDVKVQAYQDYISNNLPDDVNKDQALQDIGSVIQQGVIASLMKCGKDIENSHFVSANGAQPQYNVQASPEKGVFYVEITASKKNAHTIHLSNANSEKDIGLGSMEYFAGNVKADCKMTMLVKVDVRNNKGNSSESATTVKVLSGGCNWLINREGQWDESGREWSNDLPETTTEVHSWEQLRGEPSAKRGQRILEQLETASLDETDSYRNLMALVEEVAYGSETLSEAQAILDAAEKLKSTPSGNAKIDNAITQYCNDVVAEHSKLIPGPPSL